MTISPTQLKRELSEPQIKKFWLGYFQENFREEIHQKLVELFDELQAKYRISRADLAKKIGRRPEQVTRWLSAPTNIESDTLSDLGLGLGVVPKLTFEPIETLFSISKPNYQHELSRFVSFYTSEEDLAAVLGSPQTTSTSDSTKIKQFEEFK